MKLKVGSRLRCIGRGSYVKVGEEGEVTQVSPDGKTIWVRWGADRGSLEMSLEAWAPRLEEIVPEIQSCQDGGCGSCDYCLSRRASRG